MLKAREIEVEAIGENGRENIVMVNGRKLFWLGLGAATMAQEELSKLVSRLVEQGEETEKERRTKINDVIEQRRKNVRKEVERVESEIDKRLETLLHRVNIPTASDIKKLNSKITRLNKQVNDLTKTIA